MPLHPIIEAELRAAAGGTPYERLPLHQARAAARQTWFGRAAPTPVAEVREIEVPGPAQPLRVRIYTPFDDGPRPLIAFFHGSGFTLLDLDTHDNVCRALCAEAGAVVASVDYRLAPEHPYPAGPHDCLAATRWLAEHAPDVGADAGTFALAGDSAGGCLAAVTALRLHQEGGPRPDALILWYPVTDHFSARWPSFSEFAQGCGLSAEGMTWFWRQYLPDASLARHPDVSPLRAASLAGLPPTWIMTAEYDVLRDEGEAFAQRASEHGVAVQLQRAAGMNHGFIKHAGTIDEATQAIASAGAWLRATVRATATEDTTP